MKIEYIEGLYKSKFNRTKIYNDKSLLAEK